MSTQALTYYLQDLQRLNRANYGLLLELIPDIDIIPEFASSKLDNAVDLNLSVIERSRYTSTVSLTHYIPVGDTWVSAPDLWIRIYHDAQVAEAIPRKDGSSLLDDRPDNWNHTLEPFQKWQLNNFMEKWLRYCLRQGHLVHCDETMPA